MTDEEMKPIRLLPKMQNMWHRKGDILKMETNFFSHVSNEGQVKKMAGMSVFIHLNIVKMDIWSKYIRWKFPCNWRMVSLFLTKTAVIRQHHKMINLKKLC